MNLLSVDPSHLRVLASLLAMPEDDALDALLDIQPQAPWLESALPELSQIPLQRWQGEHTRLFLTGYPKTSCPPYESAYRHGVMGGTAAGELVELYRHAGLQATDVPADYLGTMLECAAYLMERGMDDLLHELTDEHLRLWVPRFARDLQDAAELRFYRELGKQIESLLPEPADRD